jgi:hypothetical protein
MYDRKPDLPNPTAAKKKRKRLELFVPLQRHIFASDAPVKLPCPGGAR